MQGYKFVSGIPLLGTILAALAVLAGWGHLSIAGAGLVTLLADTGGTFGFALAVSRDPSFWSSGASGRAP